MRLSGLLVVLCTALLPARPVGAQISFVHASDLSVTEDTSPGSNGEMVSAMWDDVGQQAPAFVIITGDLTARGTDAQFATFRTLLQFLTVPYHPVLGEQDVRANPAGKEGFAAALGQPAYRSWNEGGVHFIRLDSTIPFQHQGHVDQAQLDWLKRDLERTGPDTPIVIAVHHWIGRDKPLIDNESALLDLVAPYNVRLWLTGHGRADMAWNVNGATAVMIKPLYEGSYHLVQIDNDTITVRRHQFGKPVESQQLFEDAVMPAVEWVDVATIPLQRPAPPQWSSDVSVESNAIRVSATGDLPLETKLTCSVDGDTPTAMKPSADGWSAIIPAHRPSPGRHTVSVRAILPDGRQFAQDHPAKTEPLLSPAPAWVTDIGAGVVAPLTLSQDVLYATTLGGDLVALRTDGSELWRLRLSGVAHSAPAVGKDRLYIATADGAISAVRTDSREIIWTHRGDSPALAGPALAGNTLGVAFSDGTVQGLNAHSGELLWTEHLETITPAAVTTNGTNLFIAGPDGALASLDLVSGTVSWTLPAVEGQGIAGVPVAAGGRLYAAPGDGTIRSLNAVTGRPIWTHNTERPGGGTPVVSGDLLYVAIGASGRLTCLNAADGALIWDAATPAPIDAPPVVSGERILVVSDGAVRALDARDGRPVWQYRLGPAHTIAAPIADETHLYAATFDGQVVAFRIEE